MLENEERERERGVLKQKISIDFLGFWVLFLTYAIEIPCHVVKRKKVNLD